MKSSILVVICVLIISLFVINACESGVRDPCKGNLRKCNLNCGLVGTELCKQNCQDGYDKCRDLHEGDFLIDDNFSE
jgi:hypothetical protein